MSIDAKETADTGLDHVKKATKNHSVGTKMGDNTCVKYMLLAGTAIVSVTCKIAGATKVMIPSFQGSEGIKSPSSSMEEPLISASSGIRVP